MTKSKTHHIANAARAFLLGAMLVPASAFADADADADAEPGAAEEDSHAEGAEEEEEEPPAPVEFEEIQPTAPGHLQMRLTGNSYADSYVDAWQRKVGMTSWLKATAFFGMTDRASMSVEIPTVLDVHSPQARLLVPGPALGGKYMFLKPTESRPGLVGMVELALPTLDLDRLDHLALPRASVALGSLYRWQRLTLQGFLGTELSTEGVEPVAALAVGFNVFGNAHLLWESLASGPALSPETPERFQATRDLFQRLAARPPWSGAEEESNAGEAGEGTEPLGFTFTTGPTLKWEILPSLWLGLGTQLGLTPFSQVLRHTVQLEYAL